MAQDRWDEKTNDLLAWQPKDPSVRYTDEDHVRGATLYAKICRAMAVALKECGVDRDDVAQRMAEYLNEPTFSKAMLDAYVSEARTTHTINIVRFAALIHATRDWRLLSLLPELFGFAVIEERYLSAIKAMMLRDKQRELEKLAEAEERKMREPRR